MVIRSFVKNKGGIWLHQLEHFTFNGNPLTVVDFLGSGGSADVFKCSHADQNVAVKIFKSRGEHIETERAAIDYFQSIPNFPSNRIVSCLGVTDEREGLILSPVALDITCVDYFPGYTRDQLSELINVVEAIHQQQRVFRDIRPQNILIRDDMHIMVSDFGSIIDISSGASPIPYSGTSKYASGRILDLLSTNPDLPIEPQYADDIESVLKVIYVSVMRKAYRDLRTIRYDDYARIREFWRPRMTAAVWANKVSFADLRTLIADLGF